MRVKAWRGWVGEGAREGQKERKENLRQVHGPECQKRKYRSEDVATTSYPAGSVWGEALACNLQVTSVLHWAFLTPWDLPDT